MWFYNQIVLLAIILLLATTASASRHATTIDTFSGGKTAYRLPSTKDWSDATIEFDMGIKIMSVYKRNSTNLIAKFGCETTVKPIMVIPKQEKIFWYRTAGFVILGAAGLINVIYDKYTFIGKLIKSYYIKAMITGIAGKLMLTTQDHTYFIFLNESGSPILHVRIKDGKEIEFWKKLPFMKLMNLDFE